MLLNMDQKRRLLRLARRTVELATKTGALPELPEALDRTLQAPMGAFVTLHTPQGELRGCIGNMEAARPLAATVIEMAAAAATRDPRFTPVIPAEVGGLELEISVLGPLEPVERLDEVQIGRDGLLVTGLGRRGVLLPQVATEQGWDVDAFVRHTCMKAGLPEDAYHSGLAQLERFPAEVFSEQEVGPEP